MIESLRRISSALLAVGMFAIGVSLYPMFSACTGACAAGSLFFNAAPLTNPSDATLTTTVLWGAGLYLFWLGSLSLLLLEFTKPHFLRGYFKRRKTRRAR